LEADVNPNEAVRGLRVLARERPGEPWGELFLALDAAMSNGDRLPDDWQKHRFEADYGEPATEASTPARGTSVREPAARSRSST
jgi:hypothetical protein